MINDKSLLWFIRRKNDSFILKEIQLIIREGFDYVEPCEFVDQYDLYFGEIVYGSTLEFINDHEELFKISDYGRDYIYDFISNMFGEYIKENYDFYIDDCE